MSKLKELIDRLCPNGVPYKQYGEVLEFRRGQTITEKDSIPGDYPVIAGGQKPAYFHNSFNRTGETIAVAGSGAYAGFVSWWTTPIFLSDAFSVHPKDNLLLPKYVYYCMVNIQQKIHNTKKGSGVPHVHGSSIAKFLIPIPPLEVQEEIVKILDRFAEYSAELQAELQARKEQYEYYRNLLLTFNPSASGCGTDDKQEDTITTWGGHSYAVAWKTMGEIAKFSYGYTDKASLVGDTRFIRITDITDGGCLNPEGAMYINRNDSNVAYLTKKGDLLMARTGATYGKTLYVPDDSPAIFASFLIRISLDNSKISNRFYWHLSKSDIYWNQVNKLVSKGGQPQFNANALAQVSIPVPPIELQEKIVAILDRFEALVNDLSQGLPAEIAAVKEQYEYYRNQLLTFKQLA